MAASSEQDVLLIWSGTTGTGTVGSDTIVADVGDELTLDILIEDKSCAGFIGVATGLYWDSGVITGFNASECPAPENTFGPGLCNDSQANVLTPVVAGVLESPVVAEGFDAINITTGTPGYLCETMYLGRTQFIVESAGSIEIVAGYRVGDGIIQPDYTITMPEPQSAFIEPPPGC